jgi:hypothetical protein
VSVKNAILRILFGKHFDKLFDCHFSNSLFQSLNESLLARF